WAGASREATAKALHELRDLGLIETARRDITVRDLAGLERLGRQAGGREPAPAAPSAAAVCAFRGLPASIQLRRSPRVQRSRAQMPAWRAPLPDLPLPPNGRWASAPEVELFTLTMPALTRRRNSNALFGSLV